MCFLFVCIAYMFIFNFNCNCIGLFEWRAYVLFHALNNFGFCFPSTLQLFAMRLCLSHSISIVCISISFYRFVQFTMVMLCTWNWFCSCYIIMFLFWRRCIGILFFLSFCVYSSRIHGALNFVNSTNRLTCQLTIFKSKIMYTKLITSANFVFFFIIPSNFIFLYSTDFTLVSRAYYYLFFSFFGMNENKTPDTLGYSYTTQAYSW